VTPPRSDARGGVHLVHGRTDPVGKPAARRALQRRAAATSVACLILAFAGWTVALAEVVPGGPPRDGIPPVDRPRFAAPADVASWLRDDEQSAGIGIVGRYAGTRLATPTAEVVPFGAYRLAFPAGRALFRETGFHRPYGRSPYRGYDRVGQNPFPLSDPLDPRLPAMERDLGVTVGESHRLYPFTVIEQSPVINDVPASRPIVALPQPVLRSPLDTERIAAGRRLTPLEGGVRLAFAWLAFRPESQIHEPKRF
jgi:hypothetical protein